MNVKKSSGFHGADESEKLQLTEIFTNFHSKFEMPPKRKVVSLKKLDKLYIGRF
jgi:hypothetical protein